MGRPATDKRERLVAAAIERFHRQGYGRTSLAEVAKSAGMSTGNVFYYFKSKDDLARAVVDEWCDLLAGYLAALEPLPSPWDRLQGFVDQARSLSEMYVRWGCPLAALVRDLREVGGTLKVDAARIYAVQFGWLAVQFQEIDSSPGRAEAHTRSMMVRYHGAILLAHAQGNGGLIDHEVAFLTRWLRELRAATVEDC